MTELRDFVGSYLTPPDGGFWTWAADGSRVTWKDGRDLTNRTELIQVLGGLESTGLPPLGSVLLLLAACREDWDGDDGAGHRLVHHARELVDALRPEGGPAATPRIEVLVLTIAARIRYVKNGLEQVARLPHRLRLGAGARARIARVVFEEATDRLDGPASSEVVRELVNGLNPGDTAPPVHDTDALGSLLESLGVLEKGLEGFTTVRLELKFRTGLDALPAPAALEIVTPPTVRSLLEVLAADPEHAPLARLARGLMAALNLPRRLVTGEVAAVGGVADLSNRGPLERLLVSELAHDPDVFSARVALGEALFLEREPPGIPPRRTRAVLIDCGIRLWGLPRLFATATALALAATSDRTTHLYRASGAEARPVTLGGREDLVAHLEVLVPDPHPGRALPAFVDRVRAMGGPVEPILVTAPDTVDDPEFRPALELAAAGGLLVATVSRDGAFRLDRWTARGRQRLQKARFRLEDLAPRPAPGAMRWLPVQPAPADGTLPRIMALRPCPLRFRATIPPGEMIATLESGAVGITGDGRLVHWKNVRHGLLELVDRLPRGRVLSMEVLAPDRVRILKGGTRARGIHMIEVDLERATVALARLPAPGDGIVHALELDGFLAIVYRDRIEIRDPAGGDLVEALHALPAGLLWKRDRFFLSSLGWHRLAFDGRHVALRQVAGPGSPILTMFDRRGRDGPWFVTPTGEIGCTVPGQIPELPAGAPFGPRRTIELLGCSRDGERLVLGRPDDPGNVRFVADLGRGTWVESRARALELVEPLIHQYLRYPCTFAGPGRPRRVGFLPDGSLVLSSRDQRDLTRLVRGGPTALRFEPIPWDASIPQFLRTLEPLPPAGGLRYVLARAVLPEGSRIHVDSRGLLHLSSSDPTIAELTLTSHPGPVAAWTSRGTLHGHHFFTGASQDLPVAEVETLLDRFQRRLR